MAPGPHQQCILRAVLLAMLICATLLISPQDWEFGLGSLGLHSVVDTNNAVMGTGCADDAKCRVYKGSVSYPSTSNVSRQSATTRANPLGASQHNAPTTLNVSRQSATASAKPLAGNRSLCERTGPKHWLNCREAIADKLGLQNLTCPVACVTFSAYGRLNNLLRVLANTYAHFTALHGSPRRMWKRIVLPRFWARSFGSKIDYHQLARSCIFPSWPAEDGPPPVSTRGCQQITGLQAFHGWDNNNTLRELLLSWFLLGAASKQLRSQVQGELAKLGPNFSGLHARFLEHTCEGRHKRMNMSSDICTLKPDYVAAQMKALGHAGQPFIICTDGQEPLLVKKIVQSMNGTISPFSTSPVADLLLLIHAKRFLGNSVSSMSGNVASVRHLLFADVSDALKR
mmetsp:Transcript_17813/g.44914  ORF Transcript_17813/g.44914 Transcript_17813/m.44914 type:complete len:399 (-) Transcript_17813:249-1445(-)